MKIFNWTLLGLGVAALLLWQFGEPPSHTLAMRLAAALFLALTYAILHQLYVGMRTIAELRRISVASANVMRKTSEQVTEVHQQMNRTQRAVETAGEQLGTMHDRQLAICATLRSRYPIGEGSLGGGTDDELVPEHSGEFSAYGRAMARTMQPRPLHQRPHAFDSEEEDGDDDATAVMQRPEHLDSLTRADHKLHDRSKPSS